MALSKAARQLHASRQQALANYWAHTQHTAERMRLTPAQLAHWVLYMTFRQEARLNAERMEKDRSTKGHAYTHTVEDELKDYLALIDDDREEASAMALAIMEIGMDYDPDYKVPVLPRVRE